MSKIIIVHPTKFFGNSTEIILRIHDEIIYYIDQFDKKPTKLYIGEKIYNELDKDDLIQCAIDGGMNVIKQIMNLEVFIVKKEECHIKIA